MKRMYLLLAIAIIVFLSGCSTCDNCVQPTSNAPHTFVTVTYNDCNGNRHVVPEYTDYQGRIITADCSMVISWDPCIAFC